MNLKNKMLFIYFHLLIRIKKLISNQAIEMSAFLKLDRSLPSNFINNVNVQKGT